MHHNVNERKVEKWLLENIEEDFKVNVEMKPKEKRDDPKKYRLQLQRLNDMYLLGNIEKAAYTSKSAELQRIIAELEETPKEITHKFTSNWKDLYQELDREHKRSFWRNLIQGIEIDENAKPIKILY